ncbi:MAG: hypothetical protein AAGA54_06975 [Myxococcota bacterium]
MVRAATLALLAAGSVACAGGEGPAKPGITGLTATAGNPPLDTTGPPDGALTTGIDPPTPTSSNDEGTSSSSDEGGAAEDTTTGPEPATESGDGSDASTSGGPASCEFVNTCIGADPIGGVAGDEPSEALVEMGDEPIWLEIQVSENNNNVIGEELSVTLRLDSNVGDWDLNAYRGAGGGTTGCGGELKSSVQSAGPDAVAFNWGEGTFANNTNDGAFIAIEVFQKDAACVPDASWTLTVTGNT